MTANVFEVPTAEQMKDILETAKRTGNYRDIVISRKLKASFIKTHENYSKCGIDMICDEGEGEGANLHFTKREVLDAAHWKEVLTDRLLECSHYFEDNEIRWIMDIAHSVIKYGNPEKDGEEMTIKQLVTEFFLLAKMYQSGETADGDAFVKITLWRIENLQNQECLCINSTVIDELLNDIGAVGWKGLKLKKELKNRKLSVTNQGLTYDYRIQTDEARKANASMKFVVIPLENLKDWLDMEDENAVGKEAVNGQ